MARGGIAAASARATKQAQQQNLNTTDKWIGKRFKVEPGDIVKFRSPNAHMMGGMGTVIGYLDKDTVLVLTMGGIDDDFPPMYLGIGNRVANPNYQQKNPNDNFQAHYQHHITRVAHRVNPKPPKKRKPVQFHEVRPEELPAVLTGQQQIPQGHKVVLLPEQTPTPAP